MALPAATDSILVTKNAYYNFLREYWFNNQNDKLLGSSAKRVVSKASLAWHSLNAAQRSLFEEGPYVKSCLAVEMMLNRLDSHGVAMMSRATGRSKPVKRLLKNAPKSISTIQTRSRTKKRAQATIFFKRR
ncbi:uncharacterized protein LOC108600261 [Drosophila busckii]|uniref:uncharacterized protein LOC108600261 n=1 Tax=Drosophila busckii TaxID=30019 RepID=UPI00083EBE32|nr:uncharacterized protein LOC108600261 [Drosophila busckii]